MQNASRACGKQRKKSRRYVGQSFRFRDYGPLFAKRFNEVFFKSYEGFSHDRLRYFSDELFERGAKTGDLRRDPELVAAGKKVGQRQVVITGALDFHHRPARDTHGHRRLQGQSHGIRQRLFDRAA